jgi:DNA adenine methylase
MPRLVEWFRELSARLRHVRVLNGDWTRAVTSGATKSLNVGRGGHAGIFLDPPYADTADRDTDLYATDSTTVAHAVREWCLTHGDDPAYRIVLAGFDGEHGDALDAAGWTEREWFTDGWLTGGMGNTSHQQHRERLWLSPHCLSDDSGQLGLFGTDGVMGG